MSVQEWNGAFKKSPYSKKSGAFMSVSVFFYSPVAFLHLEIIHDDQGTHRKFINIHHTFNSSSTKERHDSKAATQTTLTSSKKYFPQPFGTDRNMLKNSTALDSTFLHSPCDSSSVGEGSDLYTNAVLLTD